MKIALVSSLPVPRVYGGMDRLLEGLSDALRRCHPTDLVTIPVDERIADGALRGYYDFHGLDLSAYDVVISYKAPAYMVDHPIHVLYLSHRMRVFYDLYEQRDEDHARMRRLVQWMDSWAMSPARIPHIFCVGNTVTKRLKRWGGIEATPIHHPTTFKPDPPAKGEHFLAVGRLHVWKRFDLIVEAMKASGADVPLLIVGTGPEQDRLHEQAGDDPRIRLLGHVDEAALSDLYARSIAHVFPPINEDLGMVTFESFLAGKPVLTTEDSGEPAEIVEPGKTGFITAPDPGAMAEHLDWMAAHRDETEAMGDACRERVSHVTWDRLVQTLLNAAEKTRELRRGSNRFSNSGPAAPPNPRPLRRQSGHGAAETETAPSPKRPWRGGDRNPIRLLVTDNQMIDPPVGGGRVRIWELYRHLPEDFVTTYIGAHDHPGPVFRDRWLAPNFREIVLPLTTLHFKMHEVWRRLTRGDATVDVTIPLLLKRFSPRYQALLAEHLPEADLLIVSHPWMAPFLPENTLPCVYDSHNCEGHVKGQLLRRTLAGRWLAGRVERVENEAIRRSCLTLACSPADAQEFRERYGADSRSLLEIPNGVDCEAIRSGSPEQKPETRRRLGLPDRPLAVFVGSQYGPNLDAADFLIRRVAPEVPELTIGIVGGVGPAWREKNGEPQSGNARLFGCVDAKRLQQIYQAADFGFNPMAKGSGTNIKMLDYMAAGLAILTTEVGARGLRGRPGEHWRQVPLDEYANAAREMLVLDGCGREMAARARQLAEHTYDWHRIAADLAEGLRPLVNR